MMKLGRINTSVALLGFAMGVGLFAHLEWTLDVPRSGMFLGIMSVLCPSSVISILFNDFNGHSFEGFVGWLFIALLNAGPYVMVFVLARKLYFKLRGQTGI